LGDPSPPPHGSCVFLPPPPIPFFSPTPGTLCSPLPHLVFRLLSPPVTSGRSWLAFNELLMSLTIFWYSQFFCNLRGWLPPVWEQLISIPPPLELLSSGLRVSSCPMSSSHRRGNFCVTPHPAFIGRFSDIPRPVFGFWSKQRWEGVIRTDPRRRLLLLRR